ncbi:related to Protein SYM1 [Saccharomycodes ludwigii]|uniref:Protein SYM1 n=1 Tax=Saccharomycodes ludwigii TaxID=36035 RepID=A0A376B6I3_9ASCO|nr:hypothetical protein SCDLUD_003418 [Saccharomycodes ludwigii]KAH3900437.1 hypothetical protein SCDLUD_003418 [Saccharomycodes ludwigii]SSD60307.1 related to Protein SYM1 [Saccharomycodes ludwigii]
MSKFFSFYSNSIRENPKITNAITTGILFGLGDCIAQIGFKDRNAPNLTKKDKYDKYRTLRAVFYGSIIFSPIGDRWYKILQNKLNYPNLNKFQNTVVRVAFDQLVFAPIAIPFYFFTLSLMELKSWEEIKSKVKDNTWPTLKSNWVVWPAFQLINFYSVPVQHRLLSVNLISIFWNSYLSYRNSLKSADSLVETAPLVEF